MRKPQRCLSTSFISSFLFLVISILARSKSHHGAADADRVLHWLIDLYENESQKNQHSNKSMQESELYQVLQPTVDHFITVLLGYGRSRNKKKACARIEELLVEMERLHEAGLNGVKPTYQVSLYITHKKPLMLILLF
jgi:hypothetical protein